MKLNLFRPVCVVWATQDTTLQRQMTQKPSSLPSFQTPCQAMLGGRQFFECPQDVPGRRPGVAQWIYPAVPLLPMVRLGRFLTELLPWIQYLQFTEKWWSGHDYFSAKCCHRLSCLIGTCMPFEVWIQFMSLRCGRSIRMYGHRGLVYDFTLLWPRLYLILKYIWLNCMPCINVLYIRPILYHKYETKKQVAQTN